MKLTETTDETIDRCENVVAAAPDPFDPAQFRTSGVLSPQADGVRRVLTHVKVMKPPKSAFFHSHRGQDYQLRCNVIEDEIAGIKELYLVLPDVAFALPGETRGKLLKLCVTRQGVPFLWAVPQYDADSNRGVNLGLRQPYKLPRSPKRSGRAWCRTWLKGRTASTPAMRRTNRISPRCQWAS
jgi:hypothetical protein